MPRFEVTTPGGAYPVIVERGVLERWREYLPLQHGKVFVITEKAIWALQGARLGAVPEGDVLFLPGGEENKRLISLEAAAVGMMERHADRTSVIVALGGGIVTDMAGFLAAIFMRGIPVLQIPTTLLAQVDAAVGGKTGVNLTAGKNLIGSFHQPCAVLIDPEVLATLPEREFRAGLFEVIKHGVIASADMFQFLAEHREAVLAREPAALEHIIGESVRIKAFVVSVDERESGLRRILNFGHTVGHALEAETGYVYFLHGEAVAVGMRAATGLAESIGTLSEADASEIKGLIDSYGSLPVTGGIAAESILRRLSSDKKTLKGRVHFVVPTGIGSVEVVSGIDDALVLNAIRQALT